MTEKIDRNAVYVLEQGFKLQWESKLETHVLLYPEGLIKLSNSAAVIVYEFDGKKTPQDIVNLISAQCGSTDVEKDIIHFIEDAYEKRWIRKKD